jgi:hypothetical protein
MDCVMTSNCVVAAGADADTVTVSNGDFNVLLVKVWLPVMVASVAKNVSSTFG